MATRDPQATERFERVFLFARDPLSRYLARRAAPDAVEDLFAEVMTVAWRRLPDLPDGDELPWLYGTARKVLANHRRAGSRFGRLLERLALTAEAGAQVGPAPVTGRDADLEVAIAALSAADAEVLRLWAWEELAPREIAVALGISANAASIRLFRAKERLRAKLEADNGKTTLIAGHVPGVERKEAR